MAIYSIIRWSIFSTGGDGKLKSSLECPNYEGFIVRQLMNIYNAIQTHICLAALSISLFAYVER